MPTREQYVNVAINFLSADLTNSATTVNVTNTALFPTTGNYTVKIDDEFMLVSAATTGTPGTLTVTRAKRARPPSPTPPARSSRSHLRPAQLQRLVRTSLNGTNVSARRELNFVDGNGLTWSLTDNSGSDRVDVAATVSSNGEASLTAPVLANFTWLNQGSATATASSGTIYLQAPAAAGNNIRGLEITPGSTPWTVVVKLLPNNFGANYNTCGLYYRNSTSGLIETLTLVNGTIAANKYSARHVRARRTVRATRTATRSCTGGRCRTTGPTESCRGRSTARIGFSSIRSAGRTTSRRTDAGSSRKRTTAIILRP